MVKRNGKHFTQVFLLDFKKLNLEFENETKLLPAAVIIDMDNPNRLVLKMGLLQYIVPYITYQRR